MKKIRTLFLLTLLFTLFSCKQDGGEMVFTPEDVKNPATAEGIDPKVAETMPIITFDKLTYDLGRVVQGEKLTYSFKFTNTGKSDLIISNVRASCNCTSPTPPKAPIKPGESGEIKVTFNSKAKKGPVKNTVVVYSNTYPNNTVLTLTADVVTPQ